MTAFVLGHRHSSPFKLDLTLQVLEEDEILE